MGKYKLYSYHRKSEQAIHYGSTYVEFNSDSILLCDEYEWDDGDGDHIVDGEDSYLISSEIFNDLLILIPDNYKERNIFTDFEHSNDFYNELNNENEKMLFICLLNIYKKHSCFNGLINIINKNKLPYEDKSWSYP